MGAVSSTVHPVSHLLVFCVKNPSSEHKHQLERHLDGHACDHTLLSAIVVLGQSTWNASANRVCRSDHLFPGRTNYRIPNWNWTGSLRVTVLAMMKLSVVVCTFLLLVFQYSGTKALTSCFWDVVKPCVCAYQDPSTGQNMTVDISHYFKYP